MISKIEISFQVDVEITREYQQELMGILTKICKHYKASHPDREMWVFGVGDKMLFNPYLISDDEPMGFDSSILSIECAEREKY